MKRPNAGADALSDEEQLAAERLAAADPAVGDFRLEEHAAGTPASV